MAHEQHASEAFGVQRERRLARAVPRIAQRLKRDPSTTASKATQSVARAAMHLPLALSLLIFAHPAHDAILERWLPGGAYLLGAVILTARAWHKRARRAVS